MGLMTPAARANAGGGGASKTFSVSPDLMGARGDLKAIREARNDYLTFLGDLACLTNAGMMFHSILFQRQEDRIRAETAAEPACFRDLNLDQIVDAVTLANQEYNLKPFFYTSLHEVDLIKYRHEVFQDLEGGAVLQQINGFAQRMRAMREHLTQAEKLSYKYQKQSWFLEAVGIYCDAVNCLADDLSGAELQSRGLARFRDYLINYSESDRFSRLAGETQKLRTDLATVKYCILINGSTFKVRRYESETDYSADVEETFEKFKQGAAKDYRIKFAEWVEMNQVEAKILEFVTLLYPEIFADLDDYCVRNANYLDKTIATFDREIQFYVAFLEHAASLKNAGLKFCYPEISVSSKEVCSDEGFDLALAHKLIRQGASIVCNDFRLEGNERILVVSGPNQGGKTTFSRAFGQSHYLASLGCLVPGTRAKLFLFDQLLTHFEREEDIKNLRGKLQDDLVRIYDILNAATANSVVIMNEVFTSTTLRDATFLSEKIMGKIVELTTLCVWVTFIEELASFDEHTVSMVSTVVQENPALRTFRIMRKPADGLSYALSIAEKYRLTYNHLRERIGL
jgi:DNA mismatch repair protein MutS